MALVLEIKETIEVISRRDDAVGCDAEAYKDYLDGLDETKLQLKEGVEPTRFVLRKILPYAIKQRLKNDQLSMRANSNAKTADDMSVEVRMGYVLDEIRAALLDVKNPGIPELKFEKDSDGLASKKLVSLLESYGIMDELHTAFAKATSALVPKKSS